MFDQLRDVLRASPGAIFNEHKEDAIKLLKILTDLKESLKKLSYRDSAPEDGIHLLLALLVASIDDIVLHSESLESRDVTIAVCTECVRALRNACAGCSSNQNIIVRAESLESAINFIPQCQLLVDSKAINSLTSGSLLTLLRCFIQLLGNIVSGNPAAQRVVWENAFPIYNQLLQSRDNTVCNYTCMVIYTCLGSVSVELLYSTPQGLDTLVSIVDHLSSKDTEWGLLIIQKVLSVAGSVPVLWQKLDGDHQRLLLEVANSQLISHQESGEDQEPGLSADNALYLVQVFCQKAHVMLGLCHGVEVEGEETLTVSTLLELLCAVSALHTIYAAVLNHLDLIKCSLNLLQCIHMVGKEGDNVFSAVTKLSQQGTQENGSPVYGLKKDLIRLVGNLCYKHKQNQDTVREFGGIPLILDHTNIDGRNPYITQWSILAMRHLCDNNKANQDVLRSLRLDGLGDNVDTLREFGVEAELDGDKIVVKDVQNTEPSPFSKST